MTQMQRRLVRRRAFGTTRSTQRRKLQWADFLSTASVGAATAIRLNMLSNYETAKGSVTAGSTVMRVVLRLQVWPSASFTATQQFAYGVLHTSASLATGEDIAALPYEDYMLNEFGWIPFTPPAGALATPPIDRSHDIRAKRRLDELNAGLFFLLSNTGTTTLAY